jgi:uncharacterized membrane protein
VQVRSELPFERWLRDQTDVAALLLVALGLSARLLAARGSFLSPDEALHLQIASVPGVLDTYRATLMNAHPPLFALLLHFWKRIAASPWELRLLPAVFGTAFLWAAYRWARSLFGKAPALMTLALLAFLPSLVIVSAELRGYSVMLCLAAAALASLERTFEGRSAVGLGLFTGLAGLALLSHYAALWFALAAFAYSAVRIAAQRYPARFALSWAASWAVLAVLFLSLYMTHISRLRGGALEQEARIDWLRASYFRAGYESPLLFLARQTLALFHFLFSESAAGAVALFLLIFGIAHLARRRQPAAILLALPFVFSAAAGLLDRYPYGGTRHSIDLVLFAAAGVGVALAQLVGNRLWAAIVLAAVMAPAGFAVGL